MANPQPDKFTKISNELYEAIMQTDFTKRQRNILDLVIRMSYGCGKKFAILRPSDFTLVGVHRNHASAELKYLERANVIKIDGDIIYLNKNYDQWRVSLITTFDQERFNKVLQRNLVRSDSTKTVASATEMVTNDTNLVANEKKQNATEMVAPMSGEPSNDAVSERPKEILKKNNIAVVAIDKDPFKLLETKYVQRRNKGLSLSPLDCESINRVLTAGIKVDDALRWIDECFDAYKPKYPGDTIQSFTYVEKFIMDRHYRKQALEQNRREANAAYQQRNRGDPRTGEEDGTTGGYFSSIPGLIRSV